MNAAKQPELFASLEGKLRKVDRREPDALPEVDALEFAKLAHRRWGDQAARVLEHAAELASKNLDRWKR